MKDFIKIPAYTGLLKVLLRKVATAQGKKLIKTAEKTVPAEFYLTTNEPLLITELNGDGYAAVTGFLNGFAVAQNCSTYANLASAL